MERNTQNARVWRSAHPSEGSSHSSGTLGLRRLELARARGQDFGQTRGASRRKRSARGIEKRGGGGGWGGVGGGRGLRVRRNWEVRVRACGSALSPRDIGLKESQKMHIRTEKYC